MGLDQKGLIYTYIYTYKHDVIIFMILLQFCFQPLIPSLFLPQSPFLPYLLSNILLHASHIIHYVMFLTLSRALLSPRKKDAASTCVHFYYIYIVGIIL